jgi:hypothetical protein
VKHTKLEQVDIGAIIHVSFDEFKPSHIAISGSLRMQKSKKISVYLERNEVSV